MYNAWEYMTLELEIMPSAIIAASAILIVSGSLLFASGAVLSDYASTKLLAKRVNVVFLITGLLGALTGFMLILLWSLNA